jgi:hypothetical protein
MAAGCGKTRSGSLHAIVMGLATLSLAGCSGLTDVRAPDVVTPAELSSRAGAEALRAGAINGFVLVYAGSFNGQITTSGTLADEFTTAVAGTALAEADRRRIPDPDPNLSYPYAAVQRARVNARQAIRALRAYAPETDWEIAELFALAGYTEVFLAENMCSGLPLGEVRGQDIEYGMPQTTRQLFALATADFDSAIVHGQDSARVLNLARVGKGRALLGQGRFDEAALAVAAVPTSYAYRTQHSAAVQPNGVFDIIVTSRYITVADREGQNGLDFRSANDPRLPVVFVGKGRDGVTDVYNDALYGSQVASIILASGIEARLIEAEGALRVGDATTALDILNALRSRVGMSALPLESPEARRVDQLFRERAFSLFATGHRQGDLRRLVKWYQRPVESVFPTGAYPSGQTYGPDVTLTPDASQLNNPNFVGCADRSA